MGRIFLDSNLQGPGSVTLTWILIYSLSRVFYLILDIIKSKLDFPFFIGLLWILSRAWTWKLGLGLGLYNTDYFQKGMLMRLYKKYKYNMAPVHLFEINTLIDQTILVGSLGAIGKIHLFSTSSTSSSMCICLSE